MSTYSKNPTPKSVSGWGSVLGARLGPPSVICPITAASRDACGTGNPNTRLVS